MKEVEKRGFNVEDACDYIGGISRNTLYRLISDNDIGSYKIGNRRYFTKEGLDDLIDKSAETVLSQSVQQCDECGVVIDRSCSYDPVCGEELGNPPETESYLCPDILCKRCRETIKYIV
jgi:excisionase family DNA binding protein